MNKTLDSTIVTFKSSPAFLSVTHAPGHFKSKIECGQRRRGHTNDKWRAYGEFSSFRYAPTGRPSLLTFPTLALAHGCRYSLRTSA
jgi:hypothetical protein